MLGTVDRNKARIQEWPYPINYRKESEVSCDVLILGGGIAGCWAAISAAKKGVDVVLVDKGHVRRSGAGGSGCDHWQFAALNPACTLTPEELTQALIENHGGWNCGIHRYIQCREGWDALLELEAMGVKIRDSEAIFRGADFRDEKSGLLFGYDYVNRYTLRFWGTYSKPALEKECRRLNIRIFNRIMCTGLLNRNGQEGRRVVGAVGFNVRTGSFHIFRGKATILCLSRPEQVWSFSTEYSGLSSNFGQSSGDGHAMAWRAGAEFTLMERSAPYTGAFDYPYDGYGRPFAEWHACSIVDSKGKEVPYMDRDGRVIETVADRYRPSPGQKFHLLGGGSGEDNGFMGYVSKDHPCYKYMGPCIKFKDTEEKIKSGEYVPPLYADLTAMSENERRVIFGLSVAQDGKTDIAVYENYTAAGFDPDKDLIQCVPHFVGSGPPQWRAVWFNSGGLMIDWDLKTNLEGLYAAGQQMYASEDHANAATSGRYAGRKAAEYAMKVGLPSLERQQVEKEKVRIYGLIDKKNGVEWKELNAGVCRVMQEYCGEYKNKEMLNIGLKWFKELRESEAAELYARNPHELMRALEVLTVLECGEMIIHACLARKASNSFLNFSRLDYPVVDPPEWQKWITTKLEDGDVKIGEKHLDYWGDYEEEYNKHNGI